MTTIIIPLSRGLVTLVDEADYRRFSEFSFYAIHCVDRFYACSNRMMKVHGNRLLHRAILDAEKGLFVDHINGNPLDNRRENLRITDHFGNMRNRKKHRGDHPFKGVRPKGKGFQARIRIGHKQKHLGTFSTQEAAAYAYDAAAIEHYGEFALLNFEDSKKNLPGRSAQVSTISQHSLSVMVF